MVAVSYSEVYVGARSQVHCWELEKAEAKG